MMDDAVFEVVDGEFVCTSCGKTMDNHTAKSVLEGPLKGMTRYRCESVSQDA